MGLAPSNQSEEMEASFTPSHQPEESERRRLQPSILCIYAKRSPLTGDASHLLRPLLSDLSIFNAACGAAALIPVTWQGPGELRSPAGLLGGEGSASGLSPLPRAGVGKVTGPSLESASVLRGPSAAGLRARESLRQV